MKFFKDNNQSDTDWNVIAWMNFIITGLFILIPFLIYSSAYVIHTMAPYLIYLIVLQKLPFGYEFTFAPYFVMGIAAWVIGKIHFGNYGWQRALNMFLKFTFVFGMSVHMILILKYAA